MVALISVSFCHGHAWSFFCACVCWRVSLCARMRTKFIAAPPFNRYWNRIFRTWCIESSPSGHYSEYLSSYQVRPVERVFFWFFSFFDTILTKHECKRDNNKYQRRRQRQKWKKQESPDKYIFLQNLFVLFFYLVFSTENEEGFYMNIVLFLIFINQWLKHLKCRTIR